MLEIPPSSLRRYAVVFEPFFTPQASIKGKKRRYTEADIVTLQRIRALFAQNKTAEEVTQALSTKAPIVAEGQTLALIPGISNALASIQDILEQQQERIDTLERRLAYFEQPFWKRWRQRPPE